MMKLHHRLLPEFRRNFPEAVFMMSVGQLHTYINLDWEVGITNEFTVMQKQGITKAQLMEIVMSAQIYAGVRGLEAVYRATWPFIGEFQQPSGGKIAIPRPDWDYDIEAPFKAGLDLSTTELTSQEIEPASKNGTGDEWRRSSQVGQLHGLAPGRSSSKRTVCGGRASFVAHCRASACRG